MILSDEQVRLIKTWSEIPGGRLPIFRSKDAAIRILATEVLRLRALSTPAEDGESHRKETEQSALSS